MCLPVPALRHYTDNNPLNKVDPMGLRENDKIEAELQVACLLSTPVIVDACVDDGFAAIAPMFDPRNGAIVGSVAGIVWDYGWAGAHEAMVNLLVPN